MNIDEARNDGAAAEIDRARAGAGELGAWRVAARCEDAPVAHDQRLFLALKSLSSVSTLSAGQHQVAGLGLRCRGTARSLQKASAPILLRMFRILLALRLRHLHAAAVATRRCNSISRLAARRRPPAERSPRRR